MSDEFDSGSEPTFSAFWPLLILLIGFIIWLGAQDFSLNAQRSGISHELEQVIPALGEAQQSRARYNTLVDDLYKTAQKDEAAKPVASAAIQAGLQAGLIHVQQNAGNGTNAAPTPAAPSK